MSPTSEFPVLLVLVGVMASAGWCQHRLDTPRLAERSASVKKMEDEVLTTMSDTVKSNSGDFGQPPYWTQPDQMEHKVIAQHIDNKVVLKCPAGGNPTPAIKWLKDGVPVDEGNLQSQHYRVKPGVFQLRIPRLYPRDEGTYTCIVFNTHGTLRNDFILEALHQPIHKAVLTKQSPDQTVMVGMPVEMSCHFRSSLATVVHWARPARTVADEYNFNTSDPAMFHSMRNPDGSVFVGDTLHIEQAKLSDGGRYFCVATNNVASTLGFLKLTVLSEGEAIIETPKDVDVVVGETATFTCRTNIELHKYTRWVQSISDGNSNKTEALTDLAKGTEVLTINNVTKADAGIYACIVGFGPHGTLQKQARLYVVTAHEATEKRNHFRESLMHQPANDLHKKMSLVGLVCATVVAILCILILFLFRRYKNEKMKKKQAIASALGVIKKVIVHYYGSDDSTIKAPEVSIERHHIKVNSTNSDNNDDGNNRSRLGSENTTLTTISEYELPLDPDWEFPRSQLCLGQVIGVGAFGKVIKAEAKDILEDGQPTVVAIKMLKEGHTDQDMIDLVSEMEMLKMIVGRQVNENALNVVQLLGACTQDGPLYVIVEYAEHGNLRDYLQKFTDHNDDNHMDDGYERPNSCLSSQPKISGLQLISFARQVCKGMEFLSSKKCVHRDLAARNVLVTHDLVAKIADFGLARDIQAQDYYRKTGQGPVPIKWMAPEALDKNMYTTQSDVWSFGILLWEIMTLGSNPYPSVKVEALIHFIRQGHRMECPQNCPLNVYRIMLDCWELDPGDRPTFAKLVDRLDDVLANSKDYLEMSFPVPMHDLFHHKWGLNSAETLACGASANRTPGYSSAHVGYSLVQNHTYQNCHNFLPHPPNISSIKGLDDTNHDGQLQSSTTYTAIVDNNTYHSNNKGQKWKYMPYANHPMIVHDNLHYMMQRSSSLEEEDGEDEVSHADSGPSVHLETLSLGAFNENYAEHLQSSEL